MVTRLLITVALSLGLYVQAYSQTERGEVTGLRIPNPNFSEDVENDGVPDKWTIETPDAVQVVTDKAVKDRAARFDKTGKLLSCDMSAEDLANTKLYGSVHAAGDPDPGRDVRILLSIGHYVEHDGNREYKRTQLLAQPLSSDYRQCEFRYEFPEATADGLVRITVSAQGTGPVWLDEFELGSCRNEALTKEQREGFTIPRREWGYLLSRINQAAKRIPSSAPLERLEREAQGVLLKLKLEDSSLPDTFDDLAKRLQSCDAELNRTMAPGQEAVAWLSDAYARQRPDETIPADIRTSDRILSLGNEYHAAGLTVANCTDHPVVYPIGIEGLDAAATDIVVRRQVFLKNWYQKGTIRLADPLTVVPRSGGKWQLEVPPGGMVKVFIGFKTKPDIAGTFPVDVYVGDRKLTVSLDILNRNLPTTPRLEQLQCAYPLKPPSGRHPDLTAKDFAEHYVTAMEITHVPSILFDGDGNVIRHAIGKGVHAAWVKAYSKYGIRMCLFWHGGTFKSSAGPIHQYRDDGSFNPIWQHAYKNMIRTFLAFSEKEYGIGPEHYMLWPTDEPASGQDYRNPPGKTVRRARIMCEFAKEAAPEVPVFLTQTYYALPEDVQHYLPPVDVVVPYWPYPAKQLPRTPQGYEPRKTFHDRILPHLESERDKRGLKIWSYSIEAGKTGPVLFHRTYPICAVGLGYTGTGLWAYNVSSGLTWDDTDGKILDYNLIYDGEEDHPVNKKYNVTKEIIVPSIRWEAVRSGMQDGQILLYLKGCLEQGQCDPETASDVSEFLTRSQLGGRLEKPFELAELSTFSDNLRKLASKIE